MSIYPPSKQQLATAAIVAVSFAGTAQADLVQIDVLADTYIRNDAGGPNSKNDGDSDNEIIVGTNGSAAAELNGLLRFNLSALLGLGSAENLVINSVTLTGTTRAGDPGQGTNLVLNVYDYGFEFAEADATYNDPDGDGNAGTGDTTTGGTLGSLLSTANVADPGPPGQAIVYADSAAFRSALATQLAGDATLNLLLKGTGDGTQSFLRFDDEDRPDPFFLTVDVTVIPEPSSLALLGLGGLLIARRRRG